MRTRIKVKIRLLPTQAGGRKGYILSGYRPNFVFNDASSDGIIEFGGETELKVYPGEEVAAEVDFLYPERIENALHQWTSFVIREGSKIVGHGTVTIILPEDAPTKRMALA